MKSAANKIKKRKVRHKTIFEKTCKSCSKEISGIEKFLQKANKNMKLDDGTMYRLLVSCTEAVNNAIIHGNGSDPDKHVKIKCVVGKKTITIFVKDEGEGFDSESLLDPRDQENLLRESGRGVFLMRTLMDKVEFKKMKSGHTVKMKLRLH